MGRVGTNDIRLMVPFQCERFMDAAALNDKIDHLPRCRYAIDIIAEKDVQRPVLSDSPPNPYRSH